MIRIASVSWMNRHFHRVISRMGPIMWSLVFSFSAQAATNVYLTEVPDYEWHAGCFGTATGNLMGFWDRHGFPNFYTGPTAYGLAPLDSFGANYGIRALWASESGVDGRPSDKAGHIDDYYIAYANTGPDPFVTAGRPEHEPDCLGDFIGLNQNKWKNMNGECDGNIDGYSFVYWDSSGERRVNYIPGPEAGLPAIDIQSGVRAWTQYRGYSADVFTQLSDINPEAPAGKGFTFEDLKAEINSGYPVLMFLQDVRGKSRFFPQMANANPLIHGVLAYGYYIDDNGSQFVRFRTSFAGGDTALAAWKTDTFWMNLAPLRGVIGYHPQPQITGVSEAEGQLTFQWSGPDATVYNAITGTPTKAHWYVLEQASSLTDGNFTAVAPATAEHTLAIPTPDSQPAFFRLRIVPPPTPQQ